MENVSVDQLNAIQASLDNRYHKQSAIFVQSDPLVKQYTDQFWKQLITSKKIDANWVDKSAKQVGAEWICYNTWNKLQLTEFLQKKGWSDIQIQLAATQIISRAVYPASELKASSWIKENSAICEVTGYDMTQITKDKLYDSALQLYEVKD